MKNKHGLWIIAIIALAGFALAACENPPGSTVQVAPTFTVTFDLAGGSYAGDGELLVQTVSQGEDASELSRNPISVGRIFLRWHPELDLTDITSDRTFTAQWIHLPPPGAPPAPPPGTVPPPAGPPTQQPTFTVTFNLAGGSYSGDQALLAQTVIQGQNAAGLTQNPTRTGYTFAGWNPAPDLTNVTENRTFTALWNQQMSWTAIEPGDAGSTFAANQNFHGVAFGGGRWVAVGMDGRMAHSTNGTNWTAIPGGDGGNTFAGAINGVAHGSSGWVAVGSQGRMARSVDGTTWTAILAGDEGSTFAGAINGVAHGSSGWVAVGNNGRMAHSANGTNWTAIHPGTFGVGGSTFSVNQNIIGVAYGNSGWVAVGTNGQMAHSADGTTWTLIPAGNHPFPGTAINGVAYGSGRWVAFDSIGNMAHSVDGINWTAVADSTFNTAINGVAYGNGRWVAVGNQGRMAHSVDGITWTAIQAGDAGSTFPGGSINGVAYGGGGRWVAAGASGRMAHFGSP